MLKNRYLTSFLLIGAVFLLFFFELHRIPLWSSDEGRYGEIAREMWEIKDFIVPQFNYIDYLEKPVLAPLVTALSFGLFGVSDFVTRLPTVLAALLGIFFTYFFTRKLWNKKTALYSFLILSTSMGYVLVGRFAVIDMLMIFFLSMSVFCLMHAYFEKKTNCYLTAYVFMGLTFLSKGLIGIVLPAGIFLCFLAWNRDLKAIRKTRFGWGVLIIGLIVLPWMIAMQIRDPDFFNYFILQQHFKRFATGSFGRSRPFWFFSYIMIITSFPWSVFIPSAVSSGFKSSAESRSKIKFLICWIAVIFIFFSIPKSKLPYYIVPVTVPIAILVAILMESWIDQKSALLKQRLFDYSWKLVCIACLLFAVGLNVYIPFSSEPEILALKSSLRIGSVIIFLGSLASFIFYLKAKHKQAFLSLTAMTYALLLLVFHGMVRLSPVMSSHLFAEILKPLLKSSDMVAIYSSPDRFSDLPFHLRQRVVVVSNDRGTLSFKSRDPKYAHESQYWFLTPEELVTKFALPFPRIFCLFETENLPEVKDRLKNYKVIKEAYGKILISNQ